MRFTTTLFFRLPAQLSLFPLHQFSHLLQPYVCVCNWKIYRDLCIFFFHWCWGSNSHGLILGERKSLLIARTRDPTAERRSPTKARLGRSENRLSKFSFVRRDSSVATPANALVQEANEIWHHNWRRRVPICLFFSFFFSSSWIRRSLGHPHNYWNKISGQVCTILQTLEWGGWDSPEKRDFGHALAPRLCSPRSCPFGSPQIAPWRWIIGS
jgi:hypothetical protein